MKWTILTLAFMIFLSCKDAGTPSGKDEKLPTFKFHLGTEKIIVSSDDISDEHPFVVFFFSTTCPYCTAQTEEIKQNIKLYETIDIYFLSLDPFKDIREYAEKYGLEKYKNIKIGQDYTFAFIKYFKGPGFPYLAIYGKNKKHYYSHIGNINSADLIDKLRKDSVN